MKRTALTILRRLGWVLCLAISGCFSQTDSRDVNATTASAPAAADGNASDHVPAERASNGGEQALQLENSQAADSESAQENPTAASPSATTSRTVASSSNEVLDVSFDDIKLPIQQDMVFRPFMLTDRVKTLDGKRIRINGYMLPDTKTKGIKQFVLLKNNQCKFGPGGQADHLLNVIMIDGEEARFRSEPVSVEGRLTINPFQGPDGNTWSIYDLACERVTRYRPSR